MLNVSSPPTVRVRVGRPFTVPGEDLDADTEAIMAAIGDLLPPEAREHREPTPEELALALPAGYKGDPDAEETRRPGKD
jgi:putative phosphoserine phosphatase/1-acylglycerol-3-phosphate O-acyltransferase